MNHSTELESSSGDGARAGERNQERGQPVQVSPRAEEQDACHDKAVTAVPNPARDRSAEETDPVPARQSSDLWPGPDPEKATPNIRMPPETGPGQHPGPKKPDPKPRRSSSSTDGPETDSIRTAHTSLSPPDATDHFSAAHVSLGDNPIDHHSSFVEVPDEVYDRFPRHRKHIMVALLSFCSFLSPVSSTSVLAATPEVAAEYGTDGTVINVVNAVYMLMMGISPVVWGPMSEVYGRRRINQVTAVLFFGCSIGTALAPNLAAFFIFRILTAFEGTAFILVGSACIADIYHPTKRATALGWFLSGTLIGPAFGPFIGGIIVSHTSWRAIFWLQTALSFLAAVFPFTPFLPETIHHRKADDLEGYSPRQKVGVLWGMVSVCVCRDGVRVAGREGDWGGVVLDDYGAVSGGEYRGDSGNDLVGRGWRDGVDRRRRAKRVAAQDVAMKELEKNG
ncbi:hypothetical protein N0V88_002426 [Collariella sp. IMI 366227]|nr:hypothetical protein N0V88_002426 [Collariella sp. IMI 366227]